MHQDHHEGLLPDIKKYIGSPNPLFPKIEPQEEPQPLYLEPVPDDSNQQSIGEQEIYSIATAYSPKQLVFLKRKQRNNIRNGVQFFASHFFQQYDNKYGQPWQGPNREDSLVFDSGFEGGNLLAVYRVGEQYDLVLENDTNTGGYTQWFNFKVSNGRKKGTVKFNIVNYYKKDSLFKDSMKPLAKSLIKDKNWKRSTYQVQYFPNDLKMEGRKHKHYRTLSFNYDFIFQQDTVQFTYCFPYSYQELHRWLDTISSPKLRVKYIGTSALKQIITMVHICSQNHRTGRKAIVLMGRQHPGETPSSFVLQYLMEELRGPGQEVSFLLDQFEFFIFPMVNVDGVTVGNYRCNLRGLDLNRCWNQEDCKETPEIFYIKGEIRKIMKKMQIVTIIDFHGHSSKFNSFFYGNSFGANNMTLPYVASKLTPFVDLSSCSFSQADSSKINTARSMLGNMIKDTGSVYTYEISLFGGLKNGKKVPFLIEHYHLLATSLLSALAKSFTEIMKEEKSLKSSLFLKEARKELQKMESTLIREEQGSDIEAQKTTLIQEKAKITSQQPRRNRFIQNRLHKNSHFILTGDSHTETEKFNEEEYIITKREDFKVPFKRKHNNGSSFSEKKKISLSIPKPKNQQDNHKEFLLSKLRIFGQNYIPIKLDGASPDNPPSKCDVSIQTDLTAKVLKMGYEKPQEIRENPSLNGYMQWYDEKKKGRQWRFKMTSRHSKSNPNGLVTTCLPFPGPISQKKIPIQ